MFELRGRYFEFLEINDINITISQIMLYNLTRDEEEQTS